MPIYEYRCSSCGFQKEYLQKVSAPLLSVCPECSKETFGKMLTAAGFQLKGGGWYATDFKHSGAGPAAKNAAKDDAASKSDSKTETAGESKSESKSDGKNDGRSNGKNDGRSDGKKDGKNATPPAATAAPASTASTAKAE